MGCGGTRQAGQGDLEAGGRRSSCPQLQRGLRALGARSWAFWEGLPQAAAACCFSPAATPARPCSAFLPLQGGRQVGKAEKSCTSLLHRKGVQGRRGGGPQTRSFRLWDGAGSRRAPCPGPPASVASPENRHRHGLQGSHDETHSSLARPAVGTATRFHWHHDL